MIRARVTTLFVFLALPLGTESTAWADDTEPPPLTPEQLVALCEVLDDETVTSRFDPGTLERYRTRCSELDSPAAPGAGPGVPSTPIDSGQPTPSAPEPPTAPTPEESTATSAPPPPPPQARTSESTAAVPTGEPDPGAPARSPGHATPTSVPVPVPVEQTDTAENPSDTPVAGAFDLPTFDYADLLLTPEAAPVFGSTAGHTDDAPSPGRADLAAAGSAISLATEQDRLPRSILLATVLVSLTGVALLRSYLARRN